MIPKGHSLPQVKEISAIFVTDINVNVNVNVAIEKTNIHVLFTQFFCSGLGHQHTKGADGSRYQSIYEPTEPSQPMSPCHIYNEST